MVKPNGKDYPDGEVKPVNREIEPQGAPSDLFFGVRRADAVIVVIHDLGMGV